MRAWRLASGMAGGQFATAAGPSPDPTDSYWSNVILLSHFDGTSGQTSATDQKGATINFSSGAQLVSGSKFGPTALGLPGTPSGYVQMDSSSVWNFGTNDLTLEFQLKWNGGTGGVISRRDGVAEGWAIQIESDGTIALRAKIGGTWSDRQVSSQPGAIVSSAAYQHVALTRSGNTWTIWVNGTSVGSASIAGTVDDVAKPIRVGQATSITYNENPLNGVIDELRVTKGVARYTAAFTPPTAAFPDAGPDLSKSARYWRMLFTTRSSGQYTNSSEIRFYDNAGQQVVATGRTYAGSLTYDDGTYRYPPANSFDNDLSTVTVMLNSESGDEYLQVDFGAPVSIAKGRFYPDTASSDKDAKMPRAFKLQYSANGTTWTDFAAVTGAATPDAGGYVDLLPS